MKICSEKGNRKEVKNIVRCKQQQSNKMAPGNVTNHPIRVSTKT